MIVHRSKRRRSIELMLLIPSLRVSAAWQRLFMTMAARSMSNPAQSPPLRALSPCAAGAYAQLNDWDPRLVVPGATGGMIMDIVLGTSGRARPASP
jgi:hypothetical protein